MIGYAPENFTAKFLYKKVGFIETELSSWGEQLAKYSLWAFEFSTLTFKLIKEKNLIV